MKKVVCTVTNDLTYDQRMNRICSSLAKGGYNVTLVGRRRSYSKPLDDKPYSRARLKCLFNKGKLFYIEYNIRLFFFLLFKKYDVYCGIDLDTILPVYITSKLKGKPFVYDAHEYFTEMEEVVSRPLIKKAWKGVENLVVPKAKHAYTVSEGYKELFENKYGTEFEIIRNATVLSDLPEERGKHQKNILYQGSVNVGRGLEPLVRAMQHIDCVLNICGLGDVYDDLRQLTKELNLEEKVIFHGYVQPDKLRKFTQNATIGITFFTNDGLSNQYSLANRFFDYFHNGVPQLAMNYPEYRKFNKKFKVALLLDDLEESTIIENINQLLNNQQLYSEIKQNCYKAREEYNWQNEEKKLLRIYENIQ